MVYQYQEEGEQTAKRSLSEIFKDKAVQQRYEKVQLNKEYIKMEQAYNRPITLLSYEDCEEESKYHQGQIEKFTRIYFYFSDDEEKIKHSARTQAVSLIEPLHAIGNDMLKAEGGVPTMICMRREGIKIISWFDGIGE